MKRRMIAAAAALSLMLSGFSAPVEAKDKNSDDLIKLLLGAAAVGLIINQMNGGKLFGTSRNQTQYDDDFVVPRKQPERLIPGECAMQVTINGRLRDAISDHCVREFGLSNRLPAQCAFDIRTSAGTRRVYGPQCLSDHGYRVATIRY